MDGSQETTALDRLIAPHVLFLGMAVAFAACCLGGYLSTTENHFKHFERFHFYLTPESLFYPTACQVRALARDRLDPGKIAVIIGGTSALHGSCQTRSQVWTRKLQALLGDKYQVLNLGYRNGQTQEIGALVAEMLAREYPRLIFIADLHPGWMHPSPDGYFQRYFFWDAYYKGLLLPHPERDQRLREELNDVENPRGNVSPMRRTRTDERVELQAEMSLDSVLYFNDLWNTLACTRFCTVWTGATARSFTRPRRCYLDPDPGPAPLATRYRDQLAERMIEVGNLAALARHPEFTWPDLARAARASFPRSLRKQTLLLALWYSPYYLRRMSPQKQAIHEWVSRETVKHLQQLGFPALAVGQGFEPEDYGDVMHLTESGGAKLAAAVAPQIRELARKLGYVK